MSNEERAAHARRATGSDARGRAATLDHVMPISGAAPLRAAGMCCAVVGAALWLGQPAAALLFAACGGLVVGLLLGATPPARPAGAPRPRSAPEPNAPPPRRRAAAVAPPAPDFVARAAALGVLGLPSGADRAAIRARYRALAHTHHPDKTERLDAARAEAARRRMARINAAYTTLVRA